MKKVVLFVTLLLISFNVGALELNSKNAVLYNLNENKIIYEENKDEITSIASLTKIMTTLVAIENITNWNEKVTLNYKVFEGLAEANAAVIGLRIGQTVTYNDLIYGMFLASGADATRAIAMSISGSEEKFVELMNKKATELGMKNTSFKNTTGLEANGQYSTVNDVAILLSKALENKKFEEVFTANSYTFSDNSMTVYSTLRKTASYYGFDVSYIEGAKTGYTLIAGRCLASIAYDKENDIRYLLVTTKAPTDKAYYHVKDAVTTYNYYFENYKYHNLVDKNEVVLTLPTKYGKVDHVDIKALDEIKYYLNNTFKKEDVKLKYTGENIITTKMNKGNKLGSIEVIYNDEVLNKFDVYLPEKVEFSIIVFIKDNIKIISISLVSFILIIIMLILGLKRKKKKRRK